MAFKRKKQLSMRWKVVTIWATSCLEILISSRVTVALSSALSDKTPNMAWHKTFIVMVPSSRSRQHRLGVYWKSTNKESCNIFYTWLLFRFSSRTVTFSTKNSQNIILLKTTVSWKIWTNQCHYWSKWLHWSLPSYQKRHLWRTRYAW